ncbi:transcriptional regulator, TetR family [Parafrankia sp. EAN1pec]|uniref:TetR/AcrR family transcriptional regulator n=1 Tax=Parafrankia TaxID=2994362 RepID=UPI0000543684|nr:transcriptional regulator, TetR family [Frankia sp. EAN1pec]
MSVADGAVRRSRAAAGEALRREAVEAAAELLVSAGPQALTMRRVATAIGASTTVLYTVFGGKDGVADALYREGFERLRARLEAVVAADPLVRLHELAHAYRRSALTDRSFYAVMFERAVPGYEPGPESLEVARASLAVLVDAVRDAMAAGLLGGDDPEPVARLLHAAAHGAVSLEISGHLEGEGALRCFRELTAAAFAASARPAAR